MKFIRTITMVLAVACICAVANAASIYVGPCEGKIASTGIAKAGNCEVGAALKFPQELLAPYSGGMITGIRVGLVNAEGMEGFNAWIRPSLDGGNLREASASPSAGWNEITLDEPLAIDGNPFFVGYSFSQVKSVKCISAVGESIEGGLYIAKNGNWEEPSNKKGVLSVELIVSHPSIPGTDIEITRVRFDSPVAPEGGTVRMNIDITGNALGTGDGFDVEYTVGNGKYLLHSDKWPMFRETVTLSADLKSTEAGIESDVPAPVSATILSDKDEIDSNNSRDAFMGFYTETRPRKVLIEEFTGQKCGNCPRAISTIHSCAEKYPGKMAVIAHHVGYKKDDFTVEADYALEWFYGPAEEGTSAPAVMLDRTALPGNKVPMESIGYIDTFEPRFLQALDVPAFVTLNVLPVYSESEMKIKVTGDALPLFKAVCPEPRINIFIVEDGLKGEQAGISSEDFTHSHVNRLNVTEIFGDPVDLDNGEFEREYTVKVSPDWNVGNLEIVAFIGEYDPSDRTGCKVFNTASARADNSSVTEVKDDAIVSTEYFTLDGIKATPYASGILIRIDSYSDGRVSRTKIINR